MFYSFFLKDMNLTCCPCAVGFFFSFCSSSTFPAQSLVFLKIQLKKGERLILSCGRLLVAKYLKLQFKVGSLLRCLLCSDTALIMPK